MIFNFSLLGLLTMFLLVYIYYSKEIKDDCEGKVFRGLLLGNYLIELLYLGVYIAMREGNNISIGLSKLYFSGLVIYNSLLLCYMISLILRDKYKLQQTIYSSKIKLMKYIFIVIDVVSLVLLYSLPIEFNDNIIYGVGVSVSYFMIFIYSILGFIVLFARHNSFGVKKFKDLFIIYIINVTSIIIQYYFYDICVIDIGYILITIYMYLTLENSSYLEIERLRLENDTVMKSSIDTTKFLSNMSYEIRTPLNAIDGLSQVIEDSDDINNIKEDVKDIRAASKNLVDIINGIIDIATIDTGKMEIINENYDVYAMFDNVCDIARSRLKNSKVEFKVDIAKNIPSTLMGDAGRIEQVLLNLLTNAIKYTKEGYVLFKVDVINSTSLCRLKMTISDTGIGIKKEDIKNLFERFDNNGNSNKLGLVIVKKLVELMNGKIDVESTYKKGSTFVVTIDQKVVNILEDNVENTNKKKKLDIFDGSGKRILVVDDNKLNLKVANKLLMSYKVEVIEVMSGQECLDVLANDTNFDLILMDDMMPNMSGSETLDIILKLERVEGYNIPIVVLTANAISGMKEKYLKAGFDDYLAKPIDKYELNRVMKKYLNSDKKDSD